MRSNHHSQNKSHKLLHADHLALCGTNSEVTKFHYRLAEADVKLIQLIKKLNINQVSKASMLSSNNYMNPEEIKDLRGHKKKEGKVNKSVWEWFFVYKVNGLAQK